MIITLEDYLVQLHSGQWFGFNGEHIYANLVIHSDEFTKPTEKECVDGVAKLQEEWDSQEYARKRREEYNQMGNQFEMIFDNQDAWRNKINEIKAKYPKE